LSPGERPEKCPGLAEVGFPRGSLDGMGIGRPGEWRRLRRRWWAIAGRLVDALRPMRIRPKDPGERIALGHLEREGWTAIAANRRVAAGEADLLFRDFFGRPVLVEVKSGASRGEGAFDDPGLRAGPAKIRRLAAIAEELAGELGAVPRIDLVTVRLGSPGQVLRHDRGLRLPDRIGPPRAPFRSGPAV
jgi:Holliday junction resolvase-like predicted endonuclease